MNRVNLCHIIEVIEKFYQLHDSMYNIVEKTIKNNGYKITPQRQAVISFMQINPQPLSVSDIYLETRKRYPKLSLVTVYRTLEILSNTGMLRQIKSKYAPSYQFNNTASSSIICTGCGQDAPEPPLLAAALAQTEKELGYKEKTLKVVGLCGDCTKGRI